MLFDWIAATGIVTLSMLSLGAYVYIAYCFVCLCGGIKIK